MQNFNDKSKTDLKLRAYHFGLDIIKLCDTLPNKRAAWVIADQLIRCGCSVGANLVEAKAASSRLEFKKFNEIALKSANESQFWLCLLRDAGLSEKNSIHQLLTESVELANMLAVGVRKLKSKL